MLCPYFSHHAWVFREVVLKSLPSHLKLVVTTEVLPDAGGVQPPPEDMGRASVTGVRHLGPPEDHHLKRREPVTGILTSVMSSTTT